MDARFDPSMRWEHVSDLDEVRSMLVLRETPGLGPVRIKRLLESGEDGQPTTARDALAGRMRSSARRPVIEGLSRSDAIAAEKSAERILAAAHRTGVAVVPMTTATYPPALAQIHDPPPVLFVRGTIPELLRRDWNALRAVAVVGTRDPTARARRWAEEAGRELARAGVVVVSGLAMGIDGAAHDGVVSAAGAPAVAVLAGGPDVVRPALHQRLAERILNQGGALISEDPPGASAHPHDFVARNRIVSGLSRGVVVVEAGSRSGALHTADFALDQGRELFVVPDHPTSTRSRGTLRLLVRGAAPVLGAEDVLGHFGWDDLEAARTVSGSDRTWLERVADRAPCTIDALGADPVRATVALTRLELDGWLDRDGSGRFHLTVSGRRALASDR